MKIKLLKLIILHFSISTNIGYKPNKLKTYYFNEEWEIDYFFIMINNKFCCSICLTSTAIAKKGNLERHFLALHNNYQNDYIQN